MAKEDEIRLIAFSLWEQEGCIKGRDCEYWFKAETIWEEQKKSSKIAGVLITPPPVQAKLLSAPIKKTAHRKKK
jgi:hypothetical protein